MIQTRLFVGVLVLMVSVVPVMAQTADDCTPTAIDDAIDALYETYEEERADDSTAAAQDLADAIADVLQACADSPDVEAPVTTGAWFITWTSDEIQCPDGSRGTTSRNRPFFMDVTDEGFTAIDAWVWPPLVFTPTDEDDQYSFVRNAGDGTSTYRYDVTVVSASELQGEITLFFGDDCTVSDEFTMLLTNDNVRCMVNTEVGGNLRAGPGTDFERVDQLPLVDLQAVTGQAQDTEGFTWWQINGESWVRADVVTEVGDCESVPTIASD